MAAPCLGAHAAGAEPTEPLPAILLRLRQGNADEQVAAAETLARVRSVALLRAHKVDELLLSIIARKDALPRLRRKAVNALVTLAVPPVNVLRNSMVWFPLSVALSSVQNAAESLLPLTMSLPSMRTPRTRAAAHAARH